MDTEAFSRIYDCHYPRVFRYLLWRTRRRHEAEELTAEVFVQALEGLAAGRDPRHMGRWLVGIADHLASRFWRKRAVEYHGTDGRPDLGTRDPEALTLERLEAKALWRCLDALEPEHRQVLLLRIVAGLPARQVGTVMGRSEEAVRSLQLRALKALRRLWMEVNADARLRRDA
jgi:RNA polymerase sigma-70 factor (ECF subfamily)